MKTDRTKPFSVFNNGYKEYAKPTNQSNTVDKSKIDDNHISVFDKFLNSLDYHKPVSFDDIAIDLVKDLYKDEITKTLKDREEIEKQNAEFRKEIGPYFDFENMVGYDENGNPIKHQVNPLLIKKPPFTKQEIYSRRKYKFPKSLYREFLDKLENANLDDYTTFSDYLNNLDIAYYDLRNTLQGEFKDNANMDIVKTTKSNKPKTKVF